MEIQVGKRTKLILGIAIGAVILFSGALFGLAKFGVIKLKYLADPLYGRVEITVDPSNTGGGLSLYQGTTPITATGSFSGSVYTIPSLAYGSYTYKFGVPGPNGQPCLGPSANLSHYSAITRTTYARFTCNNGGGGSSEACSATTPCQTGLNCVNGTCQTGGGGGTTYCVRGHVQNSVTGASIQGARATIGSASGTSDSFGNYQVGNLTFANLSTAKIRFTKDGFASTAEQNITSLNSNIVAGIPCDISSNNNLGTAALVPSAPPLANTFSEIGTIKDQSNNLVGGVTVRVSCNNADQVSGVACGDGASSWQSTSYSTLQTYYSGLPSSKPFNYEVPNINRYSTYTSFPRLRISFSKTGYFWDQNGDNIDNDSGTITYIPKPTTSYVVNGNQTYLNFYNVQLAQKPEKSYYLVGKIKINDEPVGGIKVSVVGPNSYLDEKISGSNFAHVVSTDGQQSPDENIIFSKKLFKESDTGYSLQIDLSGTDYQLLNQPSIVNIGFDQSRLHQASDDGSRYWYYFEFNLEINPASATGNFTLFGKVTHAAASREVFASGEVVSVKAESVGVDLDTESEPRPIFPINSPFANYYIPNIPVFDNAPGLVRYTVSVSVPENLAGDYDLAPISPFYFTSDDLRLNADLGGLYMNKDFQIYLVGIRQKKIQFRDASSGLPINLQNESISDKLFCLKPDNTSENCEKSTMIDPADSSNSTMIYTFQDPIEGTVSLDLDFSTPNYSYKGGFLFPSGDSTLYLIRNSSTNSIVCRRLSGIDFCTYKAIENQIFTDERIANLELYAKVINTMAYYVNLSQMPDVYLYGSGESRAFARPHNDFNAGELDSQYFFALDNTDLDNTRGGIDTTVHEFGHIVDFAIGLNSKYFQDFQKALKSAQGLKDNGDPILGPDGKPLRSCNNIFQNYRCFSRYAITTNSKELWAEFFTWWILHNDEIDYAINNDENLKKPENEHCRKTLMFLDELMRSQFPRLKVFGQNSGDTSSAQNSAKVSNSTVQKAHAAYDDSQFLQIMSNVGYRVASLRTYNVVAPLVQLNLKPEDIAKGIWLRENYNQLSTTQKLNIQIGIQNQKVKNVAATISSATTTAVDVAIAAINNTVEQLLINLGFKITATSISGTVRDSEGALSGMLVSFSNKSDVTDKSGKFTITRTPSGGLAPKVENPRIGKGYSASPYQVVVKDNQKLKNVNIGVFIPKRTIKGQILIGSTPVANGKVIAYDGFKKITIKLDKNGKFSYQLKENQYLITIKDSKNKVKTITNSGTLGDLTKLKVVDKDLESMIWVK